MDTSSHEFLSLVKKTVLLHIDQSDFCANSFSKAIYLSRSQLHRRLKELTGKSTTEFIRAIRMEKAAALLSTSNTNICHIAYAVGFQNLSYFTRCFKATYGVLPSEYRAAKRTVS